MGKVLYIKANAKPEGASRTFQIADSFIESYREAQPGDEIITLDLYRENIGLLSPEDVAVVFGPKSEASKSHPVLKYAYQFAQADKYVIAEPLWNLSVPAILKAYIDYICVTGITFKYTEKGPVGLCPGRKAVNITTRGGIYSEGSLATSEMGDRYLKKVFAFFGITDYTTISAEGLDVVGNDVTAIVEKAKQEAREKAKSF